MYFTYPLEVKELQRMVDNYVESNEEIDESNCQLTQVERVDYYHLHNQAFGMIAKINPTFSRIIELFSTLLQEEEVYMILPFKKVEDYTLLYGGSPTNFIMVFPFREDMNVITELIVWETAMNLLYEMFFIEIVMKYNSQLKKESMPFLNLDNQLVVLEIQKERLEMFRNFWYTESEYFGKRKLPSRLQKIITP